MLFRSAWKAKIYPMSPNEQAELDKFLDEQLEKGYIEPSKSPLASLVFFIKKKDGKLRLIQDYRRVMRRLARGLNCLSIMTIPSFVAGLSQVRPEKTCRESESSRGFSKQRQVDLLTKSSLRLPLDRTVVYIQRDSEIMSKT